MEYAGLFVAGIIVGTIIVLVINRFRKKDLESSFSALSLDALRKNSEEFLKLANQTLATQTQTGAGQLEEKKKLIDKTLEEIRSELVKVEKSVTEFDVKREKSFVEISTQLKNTAEQTNKLQGTTDKLQLALANTRERGQWGERMAEDILRLVGFIENVNYVKQKTQETTGTRPDYTFILPKNLKVNMDVKFPLDNYLNYLNAQSESDKATYKQKFISDARKKIKEVKTRDYINPEENTVDYAIMFIPNEQIFCFLHENDASMLDDSLKEKVMLCSPITLFAVLCVMRQAVDNFTLEQTADRILSLFGTFYEQWGRFKGSMKKVGDRIKQADEEYGRLTSTRSRMLDRPLRQIDDLRKERGILETPLVDGESELVNPDEETDEAE
ncbi:MAG: DNA recombination protein RmuC [Dehalococcoidales bacterium]|nr:DNA recombination protein RmuC [Dehalococcoidales bacterium]